MTFMQSLKEEEMKEPTIIVLLNILAQRNF